MFQCHHETTHHHHVNNHYDNHDDDNYNANSVNDFDYDDTNSVNDFDYDHDDTNSVNNFDYDHDNTNSVNNFDYDHNNNNPSTTGLTVGCEAVQWKTSLPDGAVVNACRGQNVSFPWNFTLDDGDTVHDIQWFYANDRSNEMVAIFAGSLAIQWSSSSPQENAVVDACTGDSVSFDWKFTLESGEGLQDIQWFSEDERSNQLVALDDGEPKTD
nr:hypothetical protein BaRGS_002828 [Batillaria attramentaria]